MPLSPVDAYERVTRPVRQLLGEARDGDGASAFALAGEWLTRALTRRVLLVGVAAATVGLLGALGLPIPNSTLWVLGGWLATALVLLWWWQHGAAPGKALRLHMLGQGTDFVGAVVGAHTVGGTLWIAPLILGLSVSLGGQTLPRRTGLWLALAATATYAVVLAAEVTGRLAVTGPFAAVVRPDATLATAAVLMVGVTLVVVATVHRSFYRHLASMEQRHAQLLATARDMVVTVDAAGRYLSMNAAVEAQLGWTASHIIGDAVVDSFVEEDQPLAKQIFSAVLAGATQTAELRVRAADGAPRLLRITGSPIRVTERDAVTVAMFVGRDVTDEREQEARLADRERQLRLLVASVNETVFTVDHTFRFTAIYGRWDPVLGVGTEAVVGRTVRAVLGDGAGEAFEAPLRRALAGEAVEFETEIPLREAPRVIRLSVTPLRDDDGGIIGATGVAYDVSAQRAAERERDALQLRLEEARRIEALGRLVSGVAHELNNPLAAILSLSEQLRTDLRSTEDAVAIETIVGQAIRSRAIVRDLLSFVRPGGRRQLEPVRLDIVVADALRPLTSHMALHQVTLTVSTPMPALWIAGDVSGIEQVFTNLVLNAVQAVGAGGRVAVEVGMEGDRAVVRVTDNGPGIAPEHLPHLFEPFFTTKPVGQGTGLGLFVSRGIAQQHQGELRVATSPTGHGARFEFRVPLGSAPAPPPPACPESVAPGTAADAAPPRILLVDDEAAIRLSLRRYFERRGWTVSEARDGLEALEAIRAAEPRGYDLILCDVRMPRMDGAQLHAVLLEEAPGVLPRFLFASGDLASPDLATLLANTPCRFIEKPFELKHLGEEADRILRTAARPS